MAFQKCDDEELNKFKRKRERSKKGRQMGFGQDVKVRFSSPPLSHLIGLLDRSTLKSVTGRLLSTCQPFFVSKEYNIKCTAALTLTRSRKTVRESKGEKNSSWKKRRGEKYDVVMQTRFFCVQKSTE